MLFSELYKMMVKKVASVGFMGGDRPPVAPPLLHGTAEKASL